MQYICIYHMVSLCGILQVYNVYYNTKIVQSGRIVVDCCEIIVALVRCIMIQLKCYIVE
jgi:hypothetical protein